MHPLTKHHKYRVKIDPCRWLGFASDWWRQVSKKIIVLADEYSCDYTTMNDSGLRAVKHVPYTES